MIARAYVYAGDWVADCPRDCGNVERVKGKGFFCSYCKQVAETEWPNNLREIMEVLERRPIPHNRNWYPKGHTTAVKLRLDHGQTVEDLIQENAEHGVF